MLARIKKDDLSILLGEDQTNWGFNFAHTITNDREKVSGFWFRVFLDVESGVEPDVDPIKDLDFYKGFLEGASEVYVSVKDKL